MLNRAKWMLGISVVGVFVAGALSSTRATGAVATDADALANGAKDGGLSLMAAHDAGDFAAKDGGAMLSMDDLGNKDGGSAALSTFGGKDGGSAALSTFGGKDGGTLGAGKDAGN